MDKVLVAIDGSEHAWKALNLAARLAGLEDDELIILHVVPYEPMPQALRAFAQMEHIPIAEEEGRFHAGRTLGDRLTRQAEAVARERGVKTIRRTTVEGRPADQILEIADNERVDMIVLGSRGLSQPAAMLLGSVSHKVATHAPCSCVMVK